MSAVAITAAAAARVGAADPPISRVPPDPIDALVADVAVTRLASGMRVVSERVAGARSVCTGVWVGVGARDEPPELAGVSHFLEHLLFKGTARRSARQINDAVDREGGEMNAFTAKEYTAYYTRLPAGRLSLALDLLSDVLTAPTLRDDDITSERQVILEELAMDDDSPEDVAHRMVSEGLFPGHPLGRETAGERSSVEAITPGDIRAFFARWYRPSGFVLAAAGAVEHEELVALATRSFPPAPEPPALARRSPRSRRRPLSVRRRRTEQVHVAFGWRAFSRDDPDREALEVVNHVLGGGMSSRLFDQIREQRGLAYSVYSSVATYADAGALTAYAATAPAHAMQVIDLIGSEVRALRTGGITADELEVAVGYLTGSYLLALEEPSNRMARLGGDLTCYGEIRSVSAQLGRYQAIRPTDVARVAERVLSGGPVVAAVGPVARNAIAAALAG